LSLIIASYFQTGGFILQFDLKFITTTLKLSLR